MIIYTPMPLELVFAEPAGDSGEVREAVVDGRRLLLTRAAGDAWSVLRLISTDPADFLDPRWQPGSQVSVAPDATV